MCEHAMYRGRSDSRAQEWNGTENPVRGRRGVGEGEKVLLERRDRHFGGEGSTKAKSETVRWVSV